MQQTGALFSQQHRLQWAFVLHGWHLTDLSDPAMLLLIATLCAGLFCGAALYINLVEHPARMSCGPELAVREFAPSYRRATVLQVSLAVAGLALGLFAAWQLRDPWVAVGAVLLGAVVPFTLLVVFPTNRRLLDPSLDPSSARAVDLLGTWNRLHAGRTVLSAAAFGLLLFRLASLPPGSTHSVMAEAELRGLVARYDSAWSAKDTAAVGRLLAERYSYVTSTGRLSDRATSIGFLADTSYVLTSVRRSEVQVAVAGATARVTSRWEGTGRFQGQPVVDDQTCGQTWIRNDGGWQLFTEHCVNRPQ